MCSWKVPAGLSSVHTFPSHITHLLLNMFVYPSLFESDFIASVIVYVAGEVLSAEGRDVFCS